MPKTSKKIKTQAWNGPFNAFVQALKQLRNNPEPALLFAGTYVVVIFLKSLSSAGGAAQAARAAALEAIIFLLFALALPTYALAIADRRKISVRDFMRFDAKKYFSVIAVNILYGLIVIGSILMLVVPAIWLVPWFAFGTVVAVDKNLGPLQALKESKRLAKNHKAKVWGVIGVTILFSFCASLSAGLPAIGTALSSLLSMLVTVLSTGATAMLLRWAQRQAS